MRPQPGRNLAIAEWPTAHGPADYVLFAGLTPLAAVEAKKAIKDVPGSVEQAKRYSRDFRPADDVSAPRQRRHRFDLGKYRRRAAVEQCVGWLGEPGGRDAVRQIRLQLPRQRPPRRAPPLLPTSNHA